MLLNKGFTDVKALLGGFGAWVQANLPVEATTP